MKVFKPLHEMDISQVMEAYLPPDHNQQDENYLKARLAWTKKEGDPLQLRDRMHQAYQGTTFQKRNKSSK